MDFFVCELLSKWNRTVGSAKLNFVLKLTVMYRRLGGRGMAAGWDWIWAASRAASTCIWRTSNSLILSGPSPRACPSVGWSSLSASRCAPRPRDVQKLTSGCFLCIPQQAQLHFGQLSSAHFHSLLLCKQRGLHSDRRRTRLGLNLAHLDLLPQSDLFLSAPQVHIVPFNSLES